MERVAENVKRVRETIRAAAGRCGRAPGSIRLVAVTKTVEIGRIRAALAAGIEEIGENYLQEALPKLAELRGHAVIRHFIGHLQRNKAKHVTRFHRVHSIDSGRLADAVNDVGRENARPIDVLVQVNVVGEATKGGYALETLRPESERLHTLRGLCVRGVMTMAPFDADESTLR